MNKAILIVICDFLVSSMLTMMTGMIPGYSISTGGGQENILPRGAFEQWQVTENELEAATAAELRARLDDALVRRLELEKQLADINSQLSYTRGRLQGQEQDNAVLNRELLKVRSSLDDVGAKLDSTKDELLAETRAHSKTREQLAASETGRKSAEKEAAENKAALNKSQSELLAETKKHGETKAKLEANKSELKFAEKRAESADKELASTRQELGEIRKERDSERAAHYETKGQVTRLEGDLAQTSRDLRGMRNRLRAIEDANKQNSRETEKWRRTAHASEKVIGVRERDLAEVKSELDRKERELLVERLKRREAETQRDMMKDTVKDAVKQISDKEKELQKKDDELLKKQVELAKKEGEMQAGGTRVVSSETRVFECYAGAIVRVDSIVSEKKFGGERSGKITSFYPVVDFGNGRTMIVGALNRFAGDWDVALKFEDVTTVKMSYAPPFGMDSNSPKLLGDRMLISAENMHLAAFSYTGTTVRPLKIMDAKQVRRFGVEDMFLFKSGSFEINTRLNGRISLIADEKNPAIFIRDVGRSGLRAEQGDLVLSSQGFFVGVVSERIKINGIEGVKVLLIKDANTFWEQAVAVPLSKNPEEKFYSGYAAGMQELRGKFKVSPGFNREQF